MRPKCHNFRKPTNFQGVPVGTRSVVETSVMGEEGVLPNRRSAYIQRRSTSPSTCRRSGHTLQKHRPCLQIEVHTTPRTISIVLLGVVLVEGMHPLRCLWTLTSQSYMHFCGSWLSSWTGCRDCCECQHLQYGSKIRVKVDKDKVLDGHSCCPNRLRWKLVRRVALFVRGCLWRGALASQHAVAAHCALDRIWKKKMKE